MNLNRRQFLQLGAGGLLGSALAITASRTLGQQNRFAQSRSYENRTPPSPSPQTTLRIAVISDLNEAYGATQYSDEVKQAIARLPQWNPDLVLCSGDMVAGQNRSLSRAQIQAMWAAFDRDITQPLRQARLPFGFTLGNHDASRATRGTTFSFAEERNLAAAYWNDPAHDPGLNFVDRYKFPFYYTFQHNRVFFLVWDASSGSRMPADDIAWVERSLGSAAAQQADMRIVIGHLPLYGVAVGRDRPGEVLDDAASLHALLERYSVHTYISGHQHAYFPGHLGNLEMLHTGAMGAGPRQLIVGNLPPRKTLTLVDVNWASQDTTYTTFELPSLRQIDQAMLPRVIPSHNGSVIRRDLDWEQLTTTEQASCRVHLPSSLCHT
ncbi:metallophosphoesterase [Leptolyngbya sp. FACHB-16]|nr:metallophosphoesterase [Leptolyngbya sp. FACHB-8]MBD2157552.1 metallophosphoesterase [Leptolyngbya sp. FACHB-16]